MSSGIGVIRAPGHRANSTLNGSECVVVHQGSLALTVLLLSGPCAGREWQVCREDVDAPEGGEG